MTADGTAADATGEAADRADPERTHAVLVGVDTYGDAALAPLDGPALDACRYAAWLRERGVPADRIRLLVSPGPASRDEVAAAAARLGLTPREATEHEVWRVLTEELPAARGDLLWFAWSGHGLLDHEGHQRLFYADSGGGAPANLDAADLEAAFAEDARYAGLARKICVIDACRTRFGGAAALPVRRLGRVLARAAAPGLVECVCATQDGAAAANLGESRAGLFTSVFLPELGAGPAWPPPLRAAFARARAVMARSSDGQLPHLRTRWRDGDVHVHAPAPPPPPYLRTHAETLRRLRSEERYLTDDRLPFVSPRPGHEAAPDRLLSQLARGTGAGSGRGVLVIGVAGAGKTRTCFEVASRADRAGWLVLHLVPGSGVSARDLVTAALAQADRQPSRDGASRGARRVLLVLDYLDSYTGLHLRDLDEQLQAHDPGCRIALLASARPGARARFDENALGHLFRVADLGRDDPAHREQDREHRADIARRIFETVAPGARKAWGDPRLIEVCSERPVFALLLARVLEQQVEAGRRTPDLSELRPGELMRWLRRRLAADFGLPTSADLGAGPSRPHTWLLASVTAMLACEQDRQAVGEAVSRALAARGDREFAHDGPGVVTHLCRLGWLVTSGDSVDTVHDIVVDDLLGTALVPDQTTVRGGTLTELLDAAAGSATSLARAVRHLTRWSADQSEEWQRETAESCARWLRANAAHVAGLLRGELDQVSPLVSRLLANQPWQAGTLELWDELVEPWLERVRRERPDELPGELSTTVRAATGPLPARLLASALDCLRGLPEDHTAAGDLLLSLLRADGIGGEDGEDAGTAAWLADRALAWLARRRSDNRAVYLSGALLMRGDLPPKAARQAVKQAADWVGDHTGRAALSVEIEALLTRDDLGERADGVIGDALTWVGRHIPSLDASFVLRRLLRRPGLAAPQRDRAIGLALAWLHQHKTCPEASFVLRPLLVQPRLSQREEARAVSYARDWLNERSSAPTRDFVLSALLLRPNVPLTAIEPFATEAWQELKKEPLAERDQYLMRALLTRTDLPRDLINEIIDRALDWQRLFGPEPDATLLTVVLQAARTEAHRSDAVDLACQWLDAHPGDENATHLLDPVLQRSPGHEEGVRRSLAWLQGRATHPRASYLLRWLLRDLPLLGDRAGEVVNGSVLWLAKHADEDSARFVLQPLLAHQNLGQPLTAMLLDGAAAWTQRHAPEPGAVHVMMALLARDDLGLDQREAVTRDALVWFEANPRHPMTRKLLHAVCRKPGPGAVHAPALTALVLGDGETAGIRVSPAQVARGVLIGLLHGLPPDAERRGDLLDHVMDQLPVLGGGTQGGVLLRHLLAQPDLTGARAKRATGLARDWLAGRWDTSAIALVLATLLRNPALAPWRGDLVQRTVAWLADRAQQPSAGWVLAVLLRTPELTGTEAAAARRHAQAWLTANGPGHHAFPEVSAALAGAPPADPPGGGADGRA